MVDFNKEITVTRDVSINLTAESIIALLVHVGEIPDGAKASVSFKVPGGGDWSHMRVDVDDDQPVTVTYKEESVEFQEAQTGE